MDEFIGPMALPLWCAASLGLAVTWPISRNGLWPWRSKTDEEERFGAGKS